MRALIVVLVLVAGSAPAQEVLPPLVRAPDEPEAPSPPPPSDAPLALVPGANVRVETRTGRVSGTLKLLEPGALSLQVGSDQVTTLLLDDVQALSVKKRALLPGLIVGTGLGAVGTGLFGFLLCSLTGDISSPGECAAAGALLGSVPGAALGALIGLAVPRWPTVYERQGPEAPPPALVVEEAPSELSSWFFHPGLVGEVGLQVGHAQRLGGIEPQGGQGARLHLLALFGPHFAFGPEAGLYARAGSRTLLFPGQPPFMDEKPLFHFGVLARAGVDLGFVRPAALLGLGWYEGEAGQPGFSVGAEADMRLIDWLPLVFDVRYHDNVSDQNLDPRYLTVGLGSRVRW